MISAPSACLMRELMRSQCPIQRFVGVPGAERWPRARRIGPVRFAQHLANSAAVMPGIAIARIVHWRQLSVGNQLFQLGLSPSQQRPDQFDVLGQRPLRASASQSSHARAAQQAHQQRFGLVVGVMRGGDGIQSARDRPFVEQAIAHRPGLGLHIRLGRLRPIGEQGPVRDIEVAARL